MNSVYEMEDFNMIITVGELKEILEPYPDDMELIIPEGEEKK